MKWLIAALVFPILAIGAVLIVLWNNEVLDNVLEEFGFNFELQSAKSEAPAQTTVVQRDQDVLNQNLVDVQNPATPIAITDIVAFIGPSIVRILTPQSEGTGIIVRSDGMILTANHLVEGIRLPQEVLGSVEVVMSDGRSLTGRVVCQDPNADLAMVYVNEEGLPTVSLGDSEALVPGTGVIKLGYALNLPGSVSMATGIVSAIRRDQTSGMALIQTDAPLSPGDSGGPLLDNSGRVIGINSMKWVGPGIEGIAFALGVNEAKRTLLGDLDQGADCVLPPLGVPIITAIGDQQDADISGNILVWTDTRNGNNDILGYDLDAKREFPIATSAAEQQHARVSGNFVVWHTCVGHRCDIYGYELASSKSFPISTARGVQQFPKIAGKIVVWQDNRNGNWDIYGYNLDTKEEFQISDDPADQVSPKIGGNIVIWEDSRNDQYTASLCPGPQCDRNPDAIRVFGYDLTSGTEFPVPHTVGAIDKDIVVAIGDNPLGDWISVFNITSLRSVAAWQTRGDVIGLGINGDIVVWALNNRSNIYAYDLRSDTEFIIAMGINLGGLAISGNFVVWHDQLDSDGFDIYGAAVTLVE
ncbi:MAG: hypothetical protein BZY88_15555 [SAR202 cluster bacterium Io17-Chloro-G9]|nr:MAG: hypothetical protein BZY88_15555 [SAR202 cluster bacterium Io17-Chloro-G9]